MKNIDYKDVFDFGEETLSFNNKFSSTSSSIIKIFKNKYANPLPIWYSIVNYNIKTEEEISKRKDIKKINFNFKFGVKNDFGIDTAAARLKRAAFSFKNYLKSFIFIKKHKDEQKLQIL